MCHTPCLTRSAPSISLSQILDHILSPATTIALLTGFLNHLYLVLHNACAFLTFLKLYFTLDTHTKNLCHQNLPSHGPFQNQIWWQKCHRTQDKWSPFSAQWTQLALGFSSLQHTENSLLVDCFGALGSFVLEVFCRGAGGTQVASLRSWENLNTSLLGSPLKTAKIQLHNPKQTEKPKALQNVKSLLQKWEN